MLRLAFYVIAFLAGLEMTRWAYFIWRTKDSPRVSFPLLTSYVSVIALSATLIVSISFQKWDAGAYASVQPAFRWLVVTSVALKLGSHYWWRLTR